MEEKELKALVSLLEDNDEDIFEMVQAKIFSVGASLIPYLEEEWAKQLNPEVQKRIENLVHDLQIRRLHSRLVAWRDSGATDLLEGMWIITSYQYPEVQLGDLRMKLDRLYYDIWVEFQAGDLHPFDQIKTMNFAIFQKMKYRANTVNFHAVANSMINMVIDEKRGNPISLCVVYMLLAQRLNLPIFGVNLPNLFVLTYKTEGIQFYINVFNKGLIFSRTDIDNYVSQLNLPQNPSYYEPCTNIDIVRRTLRNLLIAYEKLGEETKVSEVRDILAILAEE